MTETELTESMTDEPCRVQFEDLESELLHAARNGNDERVRDILSKLDESGSRLIDVNCRGKSKSNMGWSPLHLASYFGHFNCSKLLLQFGADVNAINDAGDTSLHKAAYTNRVDVVTLLLQADADANILNGECQTPKLLTRNEEIKQLLTATEDSEQRKLEERFLSSARRGEIGTVTAFMKNGRLKNINCTDIIGNTALHCCSYRGQTEIAVLLLQNGINSSLKNSKGQSAYDMAQTPQMRQILDDLQTIKGVQKNVKRFEGPLYRRSRFFGWRGQWVVLERGVLSYYASRADAATGRKRKSFKYLDDAKIVAKKADDFAFAVHYSDDTVHQLSSGSYETMLTRQKWMNALEEHIAFSTYYTKRGSNYVDEDLEDYLPLGSMDDALKTALAHQQVLEMQVDQLTTNIQSIDADISGLSAVRGSLSSVVTSSRDMCNSLNHCMNIFTQQEELRQLELQQETTKSRALQDALHVLATEHHELEMSFSQSGSGVKSPRYYDTDDDEFYDCDEEDGDGDLRLQVDTDTSSFFECLTSIERPAKDQSGGFTMNGCANKISKFGARTCLPVPMFTRNDFSVWSILKQCIGKDLSRITMPIIFNEPISFLQRITEYLEYATLLQKANDCEDPVERMQYVTAFAISASASNWDRLGKPFNPLLGETYELSREDLGFRIVCEQVSHHPPVSAFHVESPHYRLYGSIYPKLKFWGKSVEVTPKGTVTLELHKHGEVYTWQNVNCSVHNIVVGKLWVEHSGVMEVMNHSSGSKAVVNFKPSGWFCRDLHKLEGYIYDKNKTKLKALYGKWVDAFFAVDTDVWEEHVRPSHPAHSPLRSPHKNVPLKTRSASEGFGPNDHQLCQDRLSSLSLDGEQPEASAPTLGSTANLNLPTQQFLWQAEPRPDYSAQNYSFTLFAIMLNEMTENIRGRLPPTDSRFRPDIRELENGSIDAAAEQKVRLEEKQRVARKSRRKGKDEWQPRWFQFGSNPHTGKEDWFFTGEYWTRDWTRVPDIF